MKKDLNEYIRSIRNINKKYKEDGQKQNRAYKKFVHLCNEYPEIGFIGNTMNVITPKSSNGLLEKKCILYGNYVDVKSKVYKLN